LAGKNIFNQRLAEFLAVLYLDSDIRLPGQRRFKQRSLAMKNGVEVSELLISEIQNSMK
jgi:LDH2 family malate/lactate/ureidoglycolate dehydrogenase